MYTWNYHNQYPESSAGIPTHNVAVNVATIAHIARTVVVVVGVRRATPAGIPIHSVVEADVSNTAHTIRTAAISTVRRAIFYFSVDFK